jgi:hypothetical protein
MMWGAIQFMASRVMLRRTVRMCLRLFLVAAPILVPVRAEWTRYLPNTSDDTPGPHSLNYFTHDALLRGPWDAKDVCEGCTPEEKAEIRSKVRVEIVKAVEVQGFEVYVVTYSCSCSQAGGPFLPARSVLVRTGSDEFREIFYARQFDQDAGLPYPAVVSASQEQTLLWFWLDTGGNKHPMEEYYFRFDSQGPTRVDLKPVWGAASSVLPSGGTLLQVNPRLGTFGVGMFTLQLPVFPDCHPWEDKPCEDIGGSVEVDFRLDGSRVTALGRRYLP